MSWISDNWLTRDSFTGVFAYPSNQSDDLNEVIEYEVADKLEKLLGHELYNLFIAEGYTEDVNNIYYKLREGEVIVKSDGNTFNYKGIGEMMKLFVIASKREKYYEDSEVGIVEMSMSNSVKLDSKASLKLAYKAYNKGVSKYYEAYRYIYENRVNFSTWEFSMLTKKSLIRY